MIGDLLLTWISESGCGTTADFSTRATWLMRTENLDLPERAGGRWLRDVSSLGHCEVDWRRGTWSVAPPVVTRLPFAGGLAVLAGARRPRLIRAIDDAGIYAEHARRPGSERDIPAPSTIIIPYDRIRDLEEIAAAIGASYSGCAASGIATMLPPTAPTIPTAPPAYDSQFEQLGDFSRQNWTTASPRDRALPDGLYREQINGRWQYLLRRNGAWYASDLSAGVFAELARRGDDVIRWRPDRDHHATTGTLIVDWGAPLPPLHSRALVLCSGFPPRFGNAAETALYDNVPPRYRHQRCLVARTDHADQHLTQKPAHMTSSSSGHLDAIQTFEHLRDAYFRYYDTPFGLADERLQAERRTLLDRDGGVYRKPLLELRPEYESTGRPLAESVTAAGADPDLAQFASTGLLQGVPSLYRHQEAALAAGSPAKTAQWSSPQAQGRVRPNPSSCPSFPRC